MRRKQEGFGTAATVNVSVLMASAMRYLLNDMGVPLIVLDFRLLVHLEFVLTSCPLHDVSNVNFIFTVVDGGLCSSSY